MTGQTTDSVPLPQRILALEAICRAADAMMADLPIYNPKIEVEAHGFAPVEGIEGLFGILITPWAINFVHVTDEPIPYDVNRLGKPAALEFPSGSIGFIWGGAEAIGLIRQASLHSPCLQFVNQAQARAEAKLKRAAAVTQRAAAAPEPPVDAVAAAPAETPTRHKPSKDQLARRDLLFGWRGKA